MAKNSTVDMITFRFTFFEKKKPDNPGLSAKQQSALANAFQAEEWLCLRYSGGCEVYLVTDQDVALDVVTDALRDTRILPAQTDDAQKMSGDQAVERFLRVAAGIVTDAAGKSLLQHLNTTYSQAVEQAYIGPVLHRLFHRGIWLHEKVRLETEFFRFAVDEAGAMRELAVKVLGSLNNATTYIVGDDAVLPDTAREFQQNGCRRFVQLTERTLDANSWIHQIGGIVRSPHSEQAIDAAVDVLLIGPDVRPDAVSINALQQRMNQRHNAPLLIFDWRGDFIEQKAVKKLYNVYAYAPKDLEHVIAHNRREQQHATKELERWLQAEVTDFRRWLISDDRFKFAGIISVNPQMQRIFELISRISQTDITVLIDGESGTGKELVARAIHQLSSRAEMPFHTINCGAIPDNLLESELFGHVKGSFTGAVQSKEGLFEMANHGTIFLDEIAELPAHLQVKLLRFLQEGEIKRVGSNETIQVDVRILAATNKNLAAMAEGGDFRSDLFYRLNVIQLTLPPLQERAEDIPLLARHFVQKFASRLHKTVTDISPEAMQALLAYHWPGNVRELENAMERALALAIGPAITLFDLPSQLQQVKRGDKPGVPTGASNGHLTLREVERLHILETVERCEGNLELASKQLDIGRTTLWRKLREYNEE